MFPKSPLNACKCFLLIGFVGLIQSFAVFTASEQQRIVGNWTSTVGGFPVRISYSESTLQIGDNGPVSYVLNDGRLTVSDDAAQSRIVSFPTRNEMIQLDPLTGTEQAFSKIE